MVPLSLWRMLMYKWWSNLSADKQVNIGLFTLFFIMSLFFISLPFLLLSTRTEEVPKTYICEKEGYVVQRFYTNVPICIPGYPAIEVK